MPRRFGLLALCGLLFAWLAAPAPLQAQRDRAQALDLIGAGVAAFRAGDLPQAVQRWGDAAALCRVLGEPALEAEALARRGEAYRVEGHLRLAQKDLSAARELARKAGEPRLLAATTGALGNLAASGQRSMTAEALLREANTTALRLGDNGLAAASGNDLGTLLAAGGRNAEAQVAYREALAAAERGGDRPLAATIEINAARSALASGEPASGAVARLRRAIDRLEALPPDHPVGLALVAAGMAALGPTASEPVLLEVAAQAFHAASAIGERSGSAVLASLASGGLGQVEERRGRFAQASQLTRSALFRARQASLTDIAWRWEWQQARIDRAQGRDAAALQGFRRAIEALETVRVDIPVTYSEGRSSYRTIFGPLYLEHADLLLRKAAADPATAPAVIREARETLERLKQTELQDYFRDTCLVEFEARRRPIDTLAADTAVLYPLVLPDRLALLLSLPGEERLVTVPVTEPRLRAEVETFRLALEQRATNAFLEPAHRLHELLVAPIEASLKRRAITTLVVVPDGVLRTIPFAALFDGRQYLVERFALATAPGLQLIDSSETRRVAAPTLAVGLSEGREGFAPLPAVAEEVQAVHTLRAGTLLLDRSFERARFQNELARTSFDVVHIASHGVVGRDPSLSFVLAHDGRISLDDLETAMKRTRYRDTPIELLVLSACQTAAGDDRAALGLAGIALKAGARSALATLWFVSDDASGALAVDFHRRLAAGLITKARALQQAQMAMLEDPVLGHPAYWAPFLLIGNWR